jgi:hypothetical protein
MKWLIFVLCLFIITNCNSKLPTVIKESQKKCVDYKPIDTFLNWSINTKLQSKWTDVDWLAKMMMSEVSDSTEIESIYLVGITAKNLSFINKTTIIKTILRPGAFSGVNHFTYHWWKAEPTTVHKRLALKIIVEDVPRKLSNIFAFCNLKLISYKAKTWFLSFKVYKNIKDVTFFVNEKV